MSAKQVVTTLVQVSHGGSIELCRVPMPESPEPLRDVVRRRPGRVFDLIAELEIPPRCRAIGYCNDKQPKFVGELPRIEFGEVLHSHAACSSKPLAKRGCAG